MRLNSCLSDEKTCGRAVANLFCSQHGATQAGAFDTTKGPFIAETLDGQKCGDQKCKVFEFIQCQ